MRLPLPHQYPSSKNTAVRSMKAMLAAAVLLLVRRYGVFAGESIWAPDRVVSVSFMCGMVACGAAAGKPMAGLSLVLCQPIAGVGDVGGDLCLQLG